MGGDYDSLVSYLLVNRKIELPENTKPDEAFSEIYLVFDYEPHYHKFSKDVISWCLRYFNNETKNGKLYLNYPMIEAFYDIDSWQDNRSKLISIVGLSGETYKKATADNTIIRNHKSKHLYRKLIPIDIFKKVAKLMKKRYENMLVDHRVSSSAEGIDHYGLLLIQLEQLGEKSVYVIATIALFLYDYNPDLIK